MSRSAVCNKSIAVFTEHNYMINCKGFCNLHSHPFPFSKELIITLNVTKEMALLQLGSIVLL